MSRVGKLPVDLPKGVKASVQGTTILVEGPKGKLSRTFAPGVSIVAEAEKLVISRASEDRKVRSLHGTIRNVVSNMVKGVSTGFTRVLVSVGVGYRMNVQGNKVNISAGFSHPVVFELPQGIAGAVADQTKLTLTGCDKELLGATADKIRAIRPPEPYKGKGIRYEGEVIQLKEGKAAGGGK